MKKFLSAILSLITVVTLFAGMNIQVNAATVKLNGSTDKSTAPEIAFDTEYATYYEPGQIIWFKFTAKDTDTWYNLWGKNTSVGLRYTDTLGLSIVDDFDEVQSKFDIGNEGYDYIKFEKGNTYYVRITQQYSGVQSAGYIKFNIHSEPDVYPETIDEATSVSIGKKYTSTIGGKGDVDFVKFNSGNMTGANLNVYNYDIDDYFGDWGFRVLLYNANKEFLWNSGKISPDTTSSNDLTLDKNKTYYLQFYSDYSSFGKYNFTISCIHKNTGRKSKVTPATVKANGKITTTCTLCGKTVSTVTIYKASNIKLAKTSLAYTGKTVTPSVVVKNCNNVALKNGKDYTVTLPKARTAIGTYKVTVKLKGNYSGSKTLTFKIIPKNPTVTVKSAKKKATISYKKVSGGVKYEIQYSTKKSSGFKNVKTNTTALKITKSGLKSKKTYYFRVRAYKKVGSTTYYSGWVTKSVKIK